jgi:hypothetical protein
MNFRAQAQTYNTYGGQSTLQLLPAFIMQGAADFGPAITQIELNFHFPHSGPPRKTLEQSHARFEASRATLPKITFRRKRGHSHLPNSR